LPEKIQKNEKIPDFRRKNRGFPKAAAQKPGRRRTLL